jgi:C-terminal processing protease CtpA/Prc
MEISDVARRYLDEVLTYIEARSIQRDSVDWTTLRATAERLSAGAVEPADTYPAIRATLRSLNDRHSFLVPAQEIAVRAQGSWTGLGLHALAPDGVIAQVHPGSPADQAGLAVGDTIVAIDGRPIEATDVRPLPLPGRERVALKVRRQGADHGGPISLVAAPYAVHLPPHGTLLPGRIGYIEMPEHIAGGDWSGGQQPGQAYAETAQRVIADLEARGVQAWIVDLRRNPGGDMFPMIAGLGPLLGDGTCCYFIGPDGSRQPISYRRGEASDGITVWVTVDDPYTLLQPAAPVAVLIGPLTASSGEFSALALRNRPLTRLFGQPTYGVPTGNETKELADGAMIFLTVCLGADRSGETFDGPILPDQVVPTNWSAFGEVDDPAVAVAMAWIDTVSGRADSR